MVQIEHQGYGRSKILEYLNNKPGNDIITANGKSINSTDFDMWTEPLAIGEPKINEPDGFIDFIVVIWRRNSGLQTSDNSGRVSCSRTLQQIKNKQGYMGATEFVSFYSSANTILRHEIAHCLFGGNNFHTGGAGADRRTFMSSVGGYSNLSSYDNSSPVYNAWDRDRMGWTSDLYNPEGQRIQARRVYSDISKDNGNKTFVLRDFVTTGDAVRIRLPYLQSESEEVFNQYIWLENHQMKSANIDHNPNTTKGIYAYVQVGKDDKNNQYSSSFSSPGN